MASMLSPGRPRPSVLATFLLLSLLIHLAVLAWLNREKLSFGELAEPPPIVVKLAPPTTPPPAAPKAPAAAKAPPGAAAHAVPPPKQQIVAPSDQENNQAPTAQAYLSDHDNSVDKQTIKRGNPDGGAQAPPPKEVPPSEQVASVPPAPPPAAKAPPAHSAPAPAPRAAPKPPPAPAARSARTREPEDQTPGETMPARKPLPGLDQLLAPPAEVLARNAPNEARANPSAGAPSDARDDPRRDLVSAPPPKPGIFGGPRGSFDDLPDVSQGNLTMLNTKADRFAPFVRRVGTRVFQNLLIYQRRDLALNDILAAHDVITVRCTLDRSGKLKDLDVEERSGSLAVDQTLLEALRQAAFDQNPPPSAANPNGEYEFIFQAQLAAAVGDGPGGPQVRAIESRLRVGLL